MDLRSLELVATCSRGLEEVLAVELAALGGEGVEVGRGMVRCRGQLELLLRANLELRSAARVLLSLSSGAADTREALYSLASAVAWEELVWRGQTVAVDVAGSSPGFRNPQFAALVVKDAVVDRLRARLSWRPDVDRRRPDVRVHLHLGAEGGSLALDTSGEPLSHRGYRPRGGPAPLSESLAAGLLLLAGYEGEAPFFDPMCGTGTIAIEAALMATGTAPGLHRAFAMERWAWVDAGMGRRLRQELMERRCPARWPVLAADADHRAVCATRRNAYQAGVASALTVFCRRLQETPVLPGGTLIVTNPPYGVRLSEPRELMDLYRDLGKVLKSAAGGCSAWVLGGEPALLKAIQLTPARRLVVYNGSLQCRYVRYDLYRDGATGVNVGDR